MTRARHAAYNPRKLIITILVIAVAVLLLAVIASRSTSREATAEPVAAPTVATPALQPTWTSYVPATPQQCRDAMDAADAAIEQANAVIDASLRALDKQKLGSPPVKEVNAAQKANKDLEKLQQGYLKLAKQCRR